MISLGIDSGTQSTKTIALDLESGEILASSSQAYGLIEGLAPGHMEQEPQTWVDAVDATVRDVLHQLGKRKDQVKAIGVSGQQHGFVPLDKKGRVIRPAKLWCDTSTAEQCKAFEAEFGGAEGLIKLAGNPILPGYTAPKILWLKQHEPKNYKALDTVLLPHDYINFHLTGDRGMEFGDASGTGLLDVREKKWCEPLIEFLDPDLADCLPPLASSRRAFGLLRENLREAWGLSQGEVTVGAGGGDNMMGAIGTGNVQPGVVTASLGTSGTIYAFAAEPVIDPRGEVAAFCDSTDRWLPLACTMNVTIATEQVRKLFGWSHEQLEASVAATPAGADGLLFLPYLNGERTPNLPRGTGVFHGLNTENMAPPQMARATMEGVTLGLAYGLQRFRELGIKPAEIRLTGGGSKSGIWRQIAADVFGVPTICLASAEGAALGAAIQGLYATLIATGKTATFRELCARIVKLDESTRATPDPDHKELYASLLSRQGDLTRRLHGAGYL
ncbi:MAG TPA: xylulokinase [Chthoniobacteraceae bacterium]|jgi:xylulokinase|nr:xylulokinase [Chthoniobacteraceae bacterium]